MNTLIVRHTGGPDEGPNFHVERLKDGKRTKPAAIQPPVGFPVEGRPNRDLMLELRWYLEHFLDYPFDPETDHADRVLDALRNWGRQAFDILFDTRQGGEFLKGATDDGRYDRLHLQISSDDPRILAWPWEALEDTAAGLLAQTCQIERRLNQVVDPPPLDERLPRDRVNILLVTARRFEGPLTIRRSFGVPRSRQYNPLARRSPELAGGQPGKLNVYRATAPQGRPFEWKRAMKQATTLSEVLQSCDPRPLRREELDEFFVNTADARDPVISRRDDLRKRLVRQPSTNSKLLVFGHSGCGKSTELVKLADEVAGSFFTVAFSVLQECNLFRVPVEDLLVIMMERLLDACEKGGLSPAVQQSDETLKAIYDWFAEELDIKEERIEAGGEAEAGIDASRTMLGKVLGLLIRMKGFIRRADTRVHSMAYRKPHRLGALAERCNLLINAVKQALHETQRHLLIVIEDLDKVNLVDARRMFLEHPAVLAELKAAIICTVPIFLLHSPDRAALEQHFAMIELPMLKVFEFDGSPSPEGQQAIQDIIARRVRDGLIQPDALTLLIEKTAGVLRDVFEVLLVAAGAAESLSEKGKQDAVITTGNVRYGLNRRKTEYARAITTIDLPDDWKLTTDDLYRKLKRLAPAPVRVLPSDQATMVLLKARAVIEYDGTGWFAVHPLVKELLEVTPD